MANRYWVGGTASWDATALLKWSSTSGGLGGEAVPTAADNVYFDAASGASTVTLSGARTCLNFSSAGFTGTISGTGTLAVSGGATFGAGGTYSNTGTWTFNATSGTNNITSNGKSFAFAMVFNGAGGTWTLQDALTLGAINAVTLTNGSIDLNSKNLTCGTFSSTNSNTRSITFGTGQIYLTGSAATIFTIATATGFSLTGTPVVNCTYSGSTGTRTINAGGNATITEANTVSFNVTAGTDIVAIGTSQSVKNLNFTGFAGTFNNVSGFRVFGNYALSAGMTLVAGTGGTTFSATSGTQQITTNSKTLDFPLTFNGIGGTFAFQDALAQGSTRAFTITNGTVKLKAGVTSIVGSFATTGTIQKFLQSTLAGSRATLSQASGIVNASYLTIKDIIATGGATWNAFTTNNNVDAGNNLGWDFSTQLGHYMYTRRKNKRILP